MQILKERAVDPMQALVPCNMLPGQNMSTVLTPFIVYTCMSAASLGPLEVYLPDKGSYSEAGRKLVQVISVSCPPPSFFITPLPASFVVCIVPADKESRAHLSGGGMDEPGQIVAVNGYFH